MMTVVLATHNGEDTIERTLDSFRGLAQPSGGWHLVVVDNASTDRTHDIASRYLTKLPMTIVKEAKLGKSNALNRGIEHVRGDLVVFADDDVLADANWLTEWRRAADRYPDLGIFGGAIEPAFEAPPPPWLKDTNWQIVLYATTARGRPEGTMAPDAMDIFGPNMAIRADILINGPRFDPRLMAGPSALLGDETEFVGRVVAAGTRAGFAPAARVRHIVQRHQVTLKWMLNRFYRHGRTMYLLDRLRGAPHAPSIGGIPRYLIRRIITRCLLLPLTAARFNAFRIVKTLRLIAYDFGAARQSRLMGPRPTPQRGDAIE
jgi:GT2 family glycosyltransferase